MPRAASGEREFATYANEAERKQALLLAMLEKSARHVWNRFKRCGFSQPTIYALVAEGIDTPERLLLARLEDLPRLSAASLDEVWRYRAQRNIHQQHPQRRGAH